MQDWSATASWLVGEQDASLWRLVAEVLQPVPWPEPSVIWESTESGGGEPSATPSKRQKEPQDGYGSREEIHGVMVVNKPSGHKLGLDQPQLGHLEEGV